MAHRRGFASVVVALAASSGLAGCGLIASLFALEPEISTDSGSPPTDASIIDSGRPDAPASDAATADQPAVDQQAVDRLVADRLAADRPGVEGGAAEAAVADSATRPDAAAVDAARQACGTVQSYPTTMNDGWSWRPFASAGTGFSVSADQVDLSLLTGNQSLAYAGLDGYRATTLRNSATRVQLTDSVGSINSGSEAYFVYQHDPDNVIGLSLRSGRVHARVKQDGTDRSMSLFDFNPTADSWWQIRHDGTTLYLEAGSAPSALSTRYATTNIDFLADGSVEFGAGTYNAVVNQADAVTFANVNAGLQRDPWCKASALVDEFDAAELAAIWRASGAQNCSAALAAGALELQGPDVDGTRCSIISTSLYDLAESAVSVQIASAPDVAGVRASLSVRSASYAIEFGREYRKLFAYETPVSGPITSMPDLGAAVGATWLRIRKTGNDVLLETSVSQSGPWNTAYQNSTTDPLDSVEIELGMSFANPGFTGSTSYRTTFDGFGRAD